MSDRLLLFAALLLAIFVSGCCSFRVRRRSYDVDSNNQGLYTKRSPEAQLLSCYTNCADCRRLYGYFRYNYTACALRCGASNGDDEDSECEAFRVEAKRTSSSEQRQACENYCNNLSSSDSCRSATTFYVELSTTFCLYHCKEGRFDDAVKVNCSTTRKNHRDIFQPA